MIAFAQKLALPIALAAAAHAVPARADVIVDWNEKTLAFTAQHRMGPPPAERVLAMVHLAMFDAINSIEQRYRPYLVQIPASPAASKEAAAAAAAGSVLANLNPQTTVAMRAATEAYLAAIPAGDGKIEGIKIGEAVAAKMLESRASDGARAPDSYRPRTAPGVYVTTAPTWAPQWPGVKPFTMTSASQFRPAAPVALSSKEWATDFNEIKELGGRTSTRRTAQQTENAKFWLEVAGTVYYPVIRALATTKKLDLVDCARLFALTTAARADAMIAVFDAKYQYEFWRPVTAIRNADQDDNPATERDAAWQPIDATPMHPEYPCAHCIAAASLAGVIEAVTGSLEIPEVAMTSPTAPGVTRRWTNLRTFVEDVSEARILAGFHYRFSTVVGRDMGRKIGEHAVKTILQPLSTASR